ncbi:MAG TPA: hypothetical protein VKQ29_17525 [Aliidongia sp.]|nr:hypothetical protein [Aliidongia sp.]
MRGCLNFLKRRGFSLLFLLVVGFSLSVPMRRGVAGEPGNKDPWCRMTSEKDEVNDWSEIDEGRIHVVRTSMQDSAQERLRSVSFLPLDYSDTVTLLRDGEKLSGGMPLYLVRASAMWLDKDYQMPREAFRELPLHVLYSRSRLEIRVVNFSLSPVGTKPDNLAIVIEFSGEIAGESAFCATVS